MIYGGYTMVNLSPFTKKKIWKTKFYNPLPIKNKRTNHISANGGVYDLATSVNKATNEKFTFSTKKYTLRSDSAGDSG